MIASIKRRLEALENAKSSADQNLRVVIVEPSETDDEALRREGVEISASTVIIVKFS